MIEENKYQTGRWERISYGIFFVGQGFIYAIISQYLMYYYTDYVHIATGIVTLIMVISKIWDAVNDTLFGVIVDRTKFKSGQRFLPWLNFTTLFLPVGTVLLFAASSEMPQSVKVIYALATYIIWDLFYTMCDVPIFALVTAMTDNIKERSQIYTIASIGGALATAATTIFLVPFFDRHGFLKTAVLVAAISLITMRPICRAAKERHRGDPVNSENVSFHDMVVYLKSNRYFRYYILYRLISSSFYLQMMPYFAKYCLGDVSFVSQLMLFAVPITLLLYLAAPLIIKRFDKILIYRVCMILYVTAYVVLYFVGWKNRTVLIVILLFTMESAIIPNILAPAIPSDCIEYGQYKTGIRKEGILFALQTFTNKFCSSMSTALSGLLLTIMGYSGADGIMSDSMQNALFAGMCWAPVIGQLIVFPLLWKYDLRDKDVQIMTDANCGKITREESEKLLSRKY